MGRGRHDRMGARTGRHDNPICSCATGTYSRGAESVARGGSPRTAAASIHGSSPSRGGSRSCGNQKASRVPPSGKPADRGCPQWSTSGSGRNSKARSMPSGGGWALSCASASEENTCVAKPCAKHACSRHVANGGSACASAKGLRAHVHPAAGCRDVCRGVGMGAPAQAQHVARQGAAVGLAAMLNGDAYPISRRRRSTRQLGKVE